MPPNELEQLYELLSETDDRSTVLFATCCDGTNTGCTAAGKRLAQALGVTAQTVYTKAEPENRVTLLDTAKKPTVQSLKKNCTTLVLTGCLINDAILVRQLPERLAVASEQGIKKILLIIPAHLATSLYRLKELSKLLRTLAEKNNLELDIAYTGILDLTTFIPPEALGDVDDAFFDDTPLARTKVSEIMDRFDSESDDESEPDETSRYLGLPEPRRIKPPEDNVEATDEDPICICYVNVRETMFKDDTSSEAFHAILEYIKGTKTSGGRKALFVVQHESESDEIVKAAGDLELDFSFTDRLDVADFDAKRAIVAKAGGISIYNGLQSFLESMAAGHKAILLYPAVGCNTRFLSLLVTKIAFMQKNEGSAKEMALVAAQIVGIMPFGLTVAEKDVIDTVFQQMQTVIKHAIATNRQVILSAANPDVKQEPVRRPICVQAGSEGMEKDPDDVDKATSALAEELSASKARTKKS